MTRADRERWNEKYATGNPNPAFTPDPLLLRHTELLDDKGWALDLACGVAHNAMFLARRGYEVLAVDSSLKGLGYARAALANQALPVHLVAADLDNFTLPPKTFSLVIVFRYLDRKLMPHIKQSLAPGGLLIYQTFNINQLRNAPQMRREYLLEPGELLQLCTGLETIATNDGPQLSDALTYLIGRRPET